jgi:DNA (cytosine-5)-methyltransferase 1
MSGAYYNENDPHAAAWLRELIKQGLIADGEVDERSIEEVQPEDVRGFTQCHWFAGIGVWSYALRNAGWSDDLSVWTGSCPCQSLSASGKRQGFSDKRHLWPAWFGLIGECKPDVIFGEQAASKDGLAWLDVVSSDLEAEGYAFGAADLCAAGLGAPHIRQRLYFVADASRQSRDASDGRRGREGTRSGRDVIRSGSALSVMADSERDRRHNWRGQPRICASRTEGNQASKRGNVQSQTAGLCDAGDVGNADSPRSQGHGRFINQHDTTGRQEQIGRTGSPSLTNGYWRDAKWLYCRDEKYRPVEPGTFPLVTGAPARVGRLRGYGNSIVAPVAQAFIEAFLEI